MRWLLLLAAGCYQPTPPAGAPCGAGDACPSGLSCQNGFCGGGGASDAVADGTFDSPIIPPDACSKSFATQTDTCMLTPGGPLDLTGFHTYDTDLHELRDNGGVLIPTTNVVITGLAGPIDVIVTTSFKLNSSSLRATGDTPFGIIAFGDITFTGTLNANGSGGGGPGRRGSATCGNALGRNGTTDADGSSGAGGGAHAGDGGNGGEGDENQIPVASGAGGNNIALPAGPLGGCRGGTGGGGVDIGGPPGQAGGGVYLVASGTITIIGAVDAGGGGGDHGHAPNGAGGGGGSGGMIVLEAASVLVPGILAANGGGGGGGADDIVPNDGNDGVNGRLDTGRAAGGAGFGTGEGGTGGGGGSLNLDGSTSTEVADNGGGGGGGGSGFIAIGSPNVNTSGSVISPALSPWPMP